MGESGMMPHEKAELLALFQEEQRWCRDAEARDSKGNPVWFNNPDAVAWDVTGALCHLFGWARASQLFRQLHRHINGRKAVDTRVLPKDGSDVPSMVALQEFNDRPDMTYLAIREEIETMPAWRSHDEAEYGNGAESGIISEADAGATEGAAAGPKS
jgi:hypothetical protein